MSLVSRLTSVATSGVAGAIADIADRFIETDEEKSQFKLAAETLVQQRESEIEQTVRKELEAKERVIVAEMAQGDNYTKRARPTVIYMGLVVIAFNYCLIPTLQLVLSLEIKPFMLPDEFWLAWGGSVSIYSIGRSMEKSGAKNRFTGMTTGNKGSGLLD